MGEREIFDACVWHIFLRHEIVGASRNLKTRINAKDIGDANYDETIAMNATT